MPAGRVQHIEAHGTARYGADHSALAAARAHAAGRGDAGVGAHDVPVCRGINIRIRQEAATPGGRWGSLTILSAAASFWLHARTTRMHWGKCRLQPATYCLLPATYFAGLWFVDDDEYYSGRYLTVSSLGGTLPIQAFGACCMLPLPRCSLPAARCPLHAACYLLPAACYLLFVVCCPLPTACCPLPATVCLPHVTVYLLRYCLLLVVCCSVLVVA